MSAPSPPPPAQAAGSALLKHQNVDIPPKSSQGNAAPILMGFSQYHRAPSDLIPWRWKCLPAAQLVPSPADVAAREAGRQLACWGHGDTPETDYIKWFICLISYYIMPWSWFGMAVPGTLIHSIIQVLG